jgi:hypothetical protein
VWSKLYDPTTKRLKQGARGMALGRGYQIHVDRVMVFELKRFLSDIGCTYDFNEGKKVMVLPNGVNILFGSAENPDSLEGPHLDAFCWIDEAGLMDRPAWEVAVRRTNNFNAPILITTIPYVAGWLKRDVYDRWLAGDPDIEWIHCRTLDNLEYSRANYERAKATMRPEKFRANYEGEFARPYGLIFPEPSDTELFAVAQRELNKVGGVIPDDWPAFVGHDFGVNDPTTGMWSRLSPDDVMILVGEYEVSGLTFENHLDVWRRSGWDVVDTAWGDPHEKDILLRASDLGYPIIPAKADILYGIDLIWDRLMTGRLGVLPGLDGFLKHRSSYVWATDRRDEDILKDKPKDPQPARHIMDALRYSVVGLVDYGLAPEAPGLSVRSTEVGQMTQGHLKRALLTSQATS